MDALTTKLMKKTLISSPSLPFKSTLATCYTSGSEILVKSLKLLIADTQTAIHIYIYITITFRQ